MNILVTGGAGFIGGHLAERFAGDGHDVVVIDNLEPFYDLAIKQHNIKIGVRVYPEDATAGTARAREIISLSRETRLSSS